MITKTLVIDLERTSILPPYLTRLQESCDEMEFISRSDKKLKSSLAKTEAILGKITTEIDKEIIDAAPKLKYIGVLAAAFDAIDAKYARTKNIAVCNLGGYSTEAVSEFFFASLFEVIRELERAKQQARREDYSFDKFMGRELKGRMLGVIGAGKIGSRIAEIGLGLGMKVIYFSRKNKPAIEKAGAERKDLEAVLTESDFVSLNLALNGETRGIINKQRIDLLKKDCVFINLAPPKLIDQEAIRAKADGGEVAYIFDHSDDMEPSLVKRFLATKNCVVYPPVAFRTDEANTARWETFVSNVENFAKGKPRNVVN